MLAFFSRAGSSSPGGGLAASDDDMSPPGVPRVTTPTPTEGGGHGEGGGGPTQAWQAMLDVASGRGFRLFLLASYVSCVYVFQRQSPQVAERFPDMWPSGIPSSGKEDALLEPWRAVPVGGALQQMQQKQQQQRQQQERRRPTVLRRDTTKEEEERLEEWSEDAVGILEQAQGVARNRSSATQVHVQDHLIEIYGALGGIHTLRSQHHQATGAFQQAVGEASNLGDANAVVRNRLRHGFAEWNHHRYGAAEACFRKVAHVEDPSTCDDLAVAALGSAGWLTAAATRGGLESAEALLLQALQARGEDEEPQATSRLCSAKNDGLDAYRSLALAGLSLAKLRKRSSHGQRGGDSRAGALVDCASQVLRAEASDVGDPAVRRHARHAVGLAHLALGNAELARRQHRLVLPVEAARFEAPEELWRLACGTQVSALCSHSLLHLALVDFASEDGAAGTAHLEHLLGTPRTLDEARAAEVAEWLLRFVGAHLWLPGGSRLAVATAELLLARQRGGPGVVQNSTSNVARHLIAQSEALLQLQPQQADEALQQLLRAKILLDMSPSAAEKSSLYSSLGLLFQHAGRDGDAVESFQRELESLRLSTTAAGDGDLQRQRGRALGRLGTARLGMAGANLTLWQHGLQELREGWRIAGSAMSAGQTGVAEVSSAARKYWRAVRLACDRGLLKQCRSAKLDFLRPLACPAEEK